MHILITGGAGFIGSHLTKHHLSKGDHVTVIDNFITGNKENLKEFIDDTNLNLIEADIIDFDFSLFTFHFQLIYHLASPASPIQYKKYPLETMRVHSEGTYRILEYIRTIAPQCKFVLASTSETYGDPLEHPQKESYWGNVNPNGVRSMYDEAKRFAEALTAVYTRTYSLDCRIARIFNTFGPQMEKNDGRIISNFCYQATHGLPITIYGDGAQTRSFCYVSDLVQGLFLLGSQPNLAGEVINLGNTDERSVKDMALLIKKLSQSESSIVYNSIDSDDPRKRRPDITKAKELLGWEPKIHLEEGLEKTIAYFRRV